AASRIKEEMAAVRQQLRVALGPLPRRQVCDRRALAAGSGDALNAAGVWDEEDRTVRAPRAAARLGRIGQRLRRPPLDVGLEQPASGEEPYPSAVWRPEWHSGIVGSCQRLGDAALEWAQP